MAPVQDTKIGVIVVTYGSSDVIGDCLNGLLDSNDPNLAIAICDNASPDDTRDVVAAIAAKRGVALARVAPGEPPRPGAVLTLIESADNLGYAGGVNLGLCYFEQLAEVGLFWVLNPDSVPAPDVSRLYGQIARDNPKAGLITGRTLYAGEGGTIQSDGGWVNLRTGVCRNLNQGKAPAKVAMPDPAEVNFLSGANLVCTRDFLQAVGPMREDYFLYYEEVDWAIRGADFPIALCPDALVRHHGGTAIGSGTISRVPSAFSNYFNYRNRMWFVRRFNPAALPLAFGHSALRIGKLLVQGHLASAMGALRGLLQLPPPRSVANRLTPEAQKRAFGR